MSWRVVGAGLALALVGCGGGGDAGAGEGSRQAEAPGAEAQDRNACHLLSLEEVTALAGREVTVRDQTEASDRYSTCEFSDAAGVFAFGLTVYWVGGREQWETWQLATGIADELFQSQEGVAPSDVVEQGPVQGLGDAAYFSALLPSLVLTGDVLLELNLALVPDAASAFRALGETLLSRVS